MMALVLAGLAVWAGGAPAVSARLMVPTGSVVRARDGPPTRLECAADIELFAACVEVGATPATAAYTVAEVGGRAATQWSNVGAMLTLGAPQQAAWSPLKEIPDFAELVRLAEFSHTTGASLVASCQRIARDLRERSSEEVTAAAERAGVIIAIPLAVCFLPAFIVLGLAPIVINLATTLFNNL